MKEKSRHRKFFKGKNFLGKIPFVIPPNSFSWQLWSIKRVFSDLKAHLPIYSQIFKTASLIDILLQYIYDICINIINSLLFC